MFKTLLFALAAALEVLAYQPRPTEVISNLQSREVVNNDPYPFCNVATNPNCIADGKYLVPILDFSLQRSAGDEAYVKYLPKANYTLSKWPKGTMPKYCHFWGVERDHWNASDFIMYNVTFTDCSQPWEVGRMPVRMRMAVSTFLVYGDENSDNPDYSGYMATFAGHGIIIGRNSAYFATSLVHELGHATDANLASLDAPHPGSGTSYSDTDAWKNAVKADGYAVSAYGAGSYVEDFAEAGRAVLLDQIYPCGLIAFASNPNLGQISNQISVFKKAAGTWFQPGGECDLERKFPFPTELVQV
ncbi:hypothetical protein N0V88_005525 [Collariella sp. IMI 366227]|nr:hypothetical protein N0V88_005525 [Collariella sp. IMI 366227]